MVVILRGFVRTALLFGNNLLEGIIREAFGTLFDIVTDDGTGVVIHDLLLHPLQQCLFAFLEQGQELLFLMRKIFLLLDLLCIEAFGTIDAELHLIDWLQTELRSVFARIHIRTDFDGLPAWGFIEPRSFNLLSLLDDYTGKVISYVVVVTFTAVLEVNLHIFAVVGIVLGQALLLGYGKSLLHCQLILERLLL